MVKFCMSNGKECVGIGDCVKIRLTKTVNVRITRGVFNRDLSGRIASICPWGIVLDMSEHRRSRTMNVTFEDIESFKKE